MDLRDLFNAMPFARHLGIELTAASDGHATGHIDLADHHHSTPDRAVAHGGVSYALADTVGGAAVMARALKPTPTIDMRIDYLAPTTGARIEATGDLVRFGDSVATADVTVTDGDGNRVAEARGTYKTGGGNGETPWSDGEVSIEE